MKKTLAAALAALCLGLGPQALSAETLKVAATPVPHGDILRLVADDLKAEGYELKILEFSDFVSPNVALDAGEVQANYYQHVPFLEASVKSRGFKIESVKPVHILPMAVYSKSLKKVTDIKKKGLVTIPNDPSNGGRALLLLQSAGLIKLKPGAGTTATVLDIAENPRRLRFKEVEAAQVPRTIEDVDLAVVNSNYAIGVGLNPVTDSIYIEDKDSPYAVVVAARKGHANDKAVQALARALTTPKVKAFMLEKYKGGVVPAF
ncbi:MAG: MetQ/NlpA family ABC transporter substrate-binding protein [Duodenibacillus sp.]|nr:MetQ/NlpA family ABC transporter substrate-binding protein [Duodenibacillus sp.]